MSSVALGCNWGKSMAWLIDPTGQSPARRRCTRPPSPVSAASSSTPGWPPPWNASVRTECTRWPSRAPRRQRGRYGGAGACWLANSSVQRWLCVRAFAPWQRRATFSPLRRRRFVRTMRTSCSVGLQQDPGAGQHPGRGGARPHERAQPGTPLLGQCHGMLGPTPAGPPVGTGHSRCARASAPATTPQISRDGPPEGIRLLSP